uniref:B30.2/SPRY domain-containing protein n=1 Tax=Globodera pallida TaxID=36090 RepID=A0A183CB08_GLOPA
MMSVYVYPASLPELYPLQFPTNERGATDGLTLQNRWDSATCHDQLTLIVPDRLIVQFTGEEGAFLCSVLAERPIPKNNFGVFYFEVKVLEIGEGDVYIGLATKQTLDGSDWEGWPYIRTRLRFGVDNDIIGCGVNLATRQIIFIKNGKRLGTIVPAPKLVGAESWCSEFDDIPMWKGGALALALLIKSKEEEEELEQDGSDDRSLICANGFIHLCI